MRDTRVSTGNPPRHRAEGPANDDPWWQGEDPAPRHAKGRKYRRWIADPCMSCSEPAMVYSGRRRPATEDTYCGVRVCHECNEHIAGRITCPFHGDDH